MDRSEDQKTLLMGGLQKVCGVFWGPGMDQCSEMLEKGYFHEFESLAVFLDPDYADAVKKLRKNIQGFPDASSLFNFLEDAYVRLFVNGREGVTAPLYQSCYAYENAPLMGAPARRMLERLEAAGLALGDHLKEPPDHLSVEIEYLYFLIENKPHEAPGFAGEIKAWAEKLSERISGETACPVYPLFARVLCSLLGMAEGNREI
jgi:TorA-specific chaperone